MFEFVHSPWLFLVGAAVDGLHQLSIPRIGHSCDRRVSSQHSDFNFLYSRNETKPPQGAEHL